MGHSGKQLANALRALVDMAKGQRRAHTRRLKSGKTVQVRATTTKVDKHPEASAEHMEGNQAEQQHVEYQNFYDAELPNGLYVDSEGSLWVNRAMAQTHEVRTALQEHWWAERHKDQPFYFRATNNAKEHLICGQIRSRDQRDGRQERGLSVSETPAYQGAAGYRYVYVVTGDVAGTGADGEPVLRNAKALTEPSRTPPRKYVEDWHRRWKQRPVPLVTPAMEEAVTMGRGRNLHTFGTPVGDIEPVALLPGREWLGDRAKAMYQRLREREASE